MAGLKPRTRYSSLQEWMEAHEINGKRLARMADISEQHMSHILRGARACSFPIADRLEQITGVDARIIARFPKAEPVRRAENLPDENTSEQAF